MAHTHIIYIVWTKDGLDGVSWVSTCGHFSLFLLDFLSVSRGVLEVFSRGLAMAHGSTIPESWLMSCHSFAGKLRTHADLVT